MAARRILTELFSTFCLPYYTWLHLMFILYELMLSQDLTNETMSAFYCMFMIKILLCNEINIIHIYLHLTVPCEYRIIIMGNSKFL
jgi:hypothetical protein